MSLATPLTTPLTLPEPIASYFAADTAGQRGDCRLLHADAVVVDERQTHVGREAIAQWKAKSAASFDYVSEPFAIEARWRSGHCLQSGDGHIPRQPRRPALRLHARRRCHRPPGDRAMSFDLGLEGRRALVTRRHQGVGAAVVDVLREAGAQVVATARTVPETSPEGVTFVAADVTSAQRLRRGRAPCPRCAWRIDIIVNVVGGSRRAARRLRRR